MVIPRLHIETRRKYLEKRKDDKVTKLEADIIDYLYTICLESTTKLICDFSILSFHNFKYKNIQFTYFS